MNKNVVPFILIIIAIGIFYTFTDGRIGQIQSVQAANSQYLSAINNSATLISQRSALLNQYNAISQSDQNRLNTMLPDNVDNVRLIIDVNGIAARHGFSIENIVTSADSSTATAGSGVSESSGSDQSGAAYGEVTISFGFTASYQNFLAFMQDLQTSLRILDITQLSVAAGTVPGTYSYTMQLTTYWLK